MKVFLDTNVILDTRIPGRSSAVESRKLIGLGYADGVKLYTSSLAVADIAYVGRKQCGKTAILEIIKGILDNWKILALGDFDIYLAAKSACPDFEDAMQISIAETECDIIITNNVQHFEGFTCLPVMTPSDFIDRITAEI